MQRILVSCSLLALSICAEANTCVPLQAGATDQSVYLQFIDETTGAPTADLVFNESGIDLEYVRNGAAAVDITEATQTAAGAHTDGGFVSVGHGRYRLDLPDAAVATGVPQVVVQGTITGYIQLPCVVALSPAANVVAFGGTAGTFNSGRPEVNTTHAAGTAWGSGAITAGSLASDAITAAKVASDVGTEIGTATWATTTRQITGTQSFNLTGSITGNLSGSVGSVTGAVGSVTGDIGGIAPNGLTLDAFNVDTNPLFGIARRGTAASATSTTLVLDTGATFGDDVVNGMTLMACGSTQGYCQSRGATDYVGSSDTATVDTWSVTPSGTIPYFLYGTAPMSGDGGGSGATAEEIWTYEDRQLTAFDEDTTTIDINATPVGAAASVTGAVGSVTGNVGGNVSGTVNGLTSTAQGNVRTAVGLASANFDTQLSTIDNNVDDIKVTTDRLDDTLELDDTVYRFTANALEQAPTGSGESLSAIADAVWDELLSGHTDEGSAGEILANIEGGGGGGLDAAGVRAALGMDAADLDDQLGAILADTAEIGTAGAGLTAIDLPDQTMNITGNLSGSVGSVSGAVGSVTGNVGGNVTGSVASVTNLSQSAREDAVIANCEVNTANFAGSTTTLACILTNRAGSSITSATGRFTGRELLVLSGTQIYEGRFITSTTWDSGNSELRLTLSRALPATLADGVTAVIR